MSAMASQITSITSVYSSVYSGADQRKLQSSASLAFVRGIHGRLNSSKKPFKYFNTVSHAFRPSDIYEAYAADEESQLTGHWSVCQTVCAGNHYGNIKGPHAESMMTSSNGNISTLLAICAGISPVTGEFPAQRPVTLSFDVFFDLRLNKWLSKHSWGWWFETPSRPLWRHCNVFSL